MSSDGRFDQIPKSTLANKNLSIVWEKNGNIIFFKT